MLEHLDADDAVEGLGLELVLCGVARDDGEVRQALRVGDRVDVFFLGARVGEGGDAGVGEARGEVERGGAPATAGWC